MNAKQILLRVFSGILALACVLSLVLTGYGFRQALDCKDYWEAEAKEANEGFDKLEDGINQTALLSLPPPISSITKTWPRSTRPKPRWRPARPSWKPAGPKLQRVRRSWKRTGRNMKKARRSWKR